MPDGLVIRGQGGLYYVKLPQGVVQCSARRMVKKGTGDLLVGDRVSVRILPSDEGVVERMLVRKNRLTRPAVANVDQVLLVMSLRSPDPLPLLIDKLLVAVGAAGFTPWIIFTKCDLADPQSDLPQLYRSIGYHVFVTSTTTGEGIGDLIAGLSDGVSVLAGPSGVGKSALSNKLQTQLVLPTGAVSRKIGRGRHTTRHASLLPLAGGGWVVDTPGFSVIDLTMVGKASLQSYFPEFALQSASCRFAGCVHRAEPDCAVKAAVAEGILAAVRYDDYLALLAEVEALPPEWARKGDT